MKTNLEVISWLLKHKVSDSPYTEFNWNLYSYVDNEMKKTDSLRMQQDLVTGSLRYELHHRLIDSHNMMMKFNQAIRKNKFGTLIYGSDKNEKPSLYL